jgi:hypothetical protein
VFDELLAGLDPDRRAAMAAGSAPDHPVPADVVADVVRLRAAEIDGRSDRSDA